MPGLDLLLKDARLPGKEELADIGVSSGKIAYIGSSQSSDAERVIKVDGRLVLPPFVDPHMHLDKAYLGGWSASTSGTYADAERTINQKKQQMTVEDVQARAGMAIERAVKNGVGYIRTNVDIDSAAGLIGMKGLLAAREQYSDLVNMEIVALATYDLLAPKSSERLLVEALDMGADVIGGSPRQELDDEGSRLHIDKIFEIAKRYEKRIDTHIDAACDPNLRSMHYLAAKTIREDYQGKVAAGHAVALSYYNEYYAERVITLLQRAGVHVVTCPATTMMSAPVLDKEPRGRGITRVRQLLQAGVNVAVGQDNMDDPYNPFGDGDPMTNGLLTAYAAQLSTDEELTLLFDMLSRNGARVMGLTDWDIAVNRPATFNVINARTLREALRERAECQYVVRAGRIIATTTITSQLYRVLN